MHITEARELLEQREEQLVRFTIDPRDTRVQVGMDEGTIKLHTGDDEFFLGNSGLSEMARFFSVSLTTFRRFPVDLRQTTINRMMQEWWEERSTEIGMYTIDGQVVSLCRPQYEHIPALTVLDAVVDGVGGKAQEELRDFELNPNGFSAKVMTDKAVDVGNVGDVSHGGIALRHSDTESFRTSLSAFLFRLICLNGLVRASSIAHGGVNAQDVFEAQAQVFDWATELYRELDDHLGAYEKLAEIPLPQPIEAIERLGQRNSLSNEAIESVMDAYALETDRPHSMYRLVNALTYTATHGEWDSHQQPQKLHNIADFILGNSDNLCAHCLSVN